MVQVLFLTQAEMTHLDMSDARVQPYVELILAKMEYAFECMVEKFGLVVMHVYFNIF
jgi:hypothetical protein